MNGKKSADKPILIVDDNVFAREGMAIYLRRKGYASQEAGDTASALKLAKRQQFMAAIVDIVMPAFPGGEAKIGGSEGIHLARKLKKTYPEMGVLVFSAFNDRGSEVLDLAVDGMRGLAYMVKGAHPDKVLQAAARGLLRPGRPGPGSAQFRQPDVRRTMEPPFSPRSALGPPGSGPVPRIDRSRTRGRPSPGGIAHDPGHRHRPGYLDQNGRETHESYLQQTAVKRCRPVRSTAAQGCFTGQSLLVE